MTATRRLEPVAIPGKSARRLNSASGAFITFWTTALTTEFVVNASMVFLWLNR